MFYDYIGITNVIWLALIITCSFTIIFIIFLPILKDVKTEPFSWVPVSVMGTGHCASCTNKEVGLALCG